MHCLRCGHCCKTSLVVIVVDPDRGPKRDNLRAVNLLEEGCPHLRGEKAGEYSCAIHNKPWYKRTPCYAHGQIETKKSSPCRMGEYLLKKGGAL